MASYRNPVLPGFHPDPSVCRVGDRFYLAVSSFEYFPGVPVYQSRNLVNWSLAGYCLAQQEDLPLAGCKPSAGIYAPTLRWHGGRFYMVTTNTSAKGHLLTFAADCKGPWRKPVIIRQSGIDPSLLFDGGKTYFCCNNLGENGRQGIFLSEIDPETGETKTVPRCISYGTGGRYVEAPHLYRIGGWYYLLLSEGGTEYGHMVTLQRAASPWGPYESCPHNPILTHRDAGGNPIQAVGHADLVQAADGNWWMVCLGIRPQPGVLLHHLGREVFLLPVRWDAEGWLCCNGGNTLTGTMEGPLPAPPLAKDSCFADAFAGALRPEWRTLRAPLPPCRARVGEDRQLHLSATDALLSTENATPALLCVPQPGFRIRCSVQAKLPAARETRCGLTAFYEADYHYDLYVQRRGASAFVCLRKRLHDLEAVVRQLPLPTGCGRVRLCIEADAQQYRFYAQPDGKSEKPLFLGTAVPAGLSTEGTLYMSFTGVMLGVFSEEGEGVFGGFLLQNNDG